MRDYTDKLERQLIRAAEAEARRPRRAYEARAARARALGVAVVLLALVGAGLTVLSAGPGPDRALAFPVLARPAVDAGALRGIVPLLVRNGADLRHARAIVTPSGTGYVVPATAGASLCLAVPDRVDGYGEGCSPAAEARAHGLYVVMATRDTAELVAVLPAGSPSPLVHHADGSTGTLPLRSGVATTVVRENATATVDVTGHVTRIPLAPIGRCVPAAPRPGDSAHGHARREVCRFGTRGAAARRPSLVLRPSFVPHVGR